MRKIFGFGSLINLDSLRTTVPDVINIKTAFVKGFFRDFSYWDLDGFRTRHFDLKGIPFCALNIKKTKEPFLPVNGIIFEMGDENFSDLLDRERDYKLIEVEIHDWKTKKTLGPAFLFSAETNTGTYDFKSPSQQRYLDECLEGARSWGPEFYETFLETTFIGNKKLKEFEGNLF